MTTSTTWTPLGRNPFRYLFSTDPWRALTYLLVSLVLGWICFGLYMLIVLLPLAPAWSFLLARVERRRITLLRVPPIADPHRTLRVLGTTARVGDRLSEPATWRETGYSLILAAAAPIVSVGLTVEAGVTGALLFAPVIVANGESINAGSWIVDTQAEAWLFTAVGVGLVPVLLYACGAISAAVGALAQALLGPREEELAAQLADVRASRGVLVDTFESERRRIERDLHDGTQRDLVGLSMHLGELAHNAPDESTRSQVIAAQDRVDAALANLRDTVRGIYPQVLGDRGVAAACVELGRGPLPVHVMCTGDWMADRRQTPEVEKALYYTAAEAVTNATKHACATSLTITLDETARVLTMDIVDDGVGGAVIGRGTGLSGLVERAATVGATLTVHSPVGGPTHLRWTKEG